MYSPYFVCLSENSSENEPNGLVLGGFSHNEFIANIFDRKHSLRSEIKDQIKNLDNSSGNKIKKTDWQNLLSFSC